MSLSTATTQKLMREFRSLTTSPPEGIRIHINDDNISHIMAEIDGPVGTPFEGGLFRVKLVLGSDFPASPPKAHFLTKLFHPNVSATGEICVNTLKKDWDPSHGIKHVLLVIRCLLIYPNPESALNQEAGKLLLENYEDYQKRATLMTRIHAKPKSITTSDNDTTTTTSTSSTSAPSSTSTSSSTTSSSIGEKENTDTKQNTNQSSNTQDSPAKKVKLATTTTSSSTTSKPMMDKETQAKLLKKKSLKRL